jgi:hypothetical protein
VSTPTTRPTESPPDSPCMASPIPFPDDEDSSVKSPTTSVVDSMSPPKTHPIDDTSDGLLSFRSWILAWTKHNEGSNFKPIEIAPTSTEPPQQTSLLRTIYTDPNLLPGWSICSKSEKAEVGLMHILNKTKGCPLFIYDSIVKWTKDFLQPQTPADQLGHEHHFEAKSGIHHDDNIIPLLRSRKKVLPHFETWSNSKNMEPQTDTSFGLLWSDTCVSLTTIPLLGSLYNLLTNEDHMQDCNLLINGDSPYDAPDPFPENLNDINTGSRYIEAYANLKKNEIDFPLGILNFVDASNYDRGDRLCTEMVAYTLTLFNRSRRYQSSAWRSMGSLPNFKKTGHKSADEKVLDYHYILESILADLENIQKCGGLLFPLKYKGTYHMVRFLPYILALLGDTPGQNALCGKMKSCSAKRLCRYCDIPKKKLSDPWFKSNLITKKKVASLQSVPAYLKHYSYKKVDIAWNKISFGGCQYGSHGNSPGEIVHTLNHGMMPVTLDGLFCSKAISAEVRKAVEREKRDLQKKKQQKRDHNQEESEDSESEEEEEEDDGESDDLLELVKDAAREEKIRQTKEKRIRNGVFGTILGHEMNYITLRIGRQLQRQSDHDLPSVFFANGVITRSKVAAHEQQGLCLLVLIVLCSTYAQSDGGIATRLGDTKLFAGGPYNTGRVDEE